MFVENIYLCTSRTIISYKDMFFTHKYKLYINNILFLSSQFVYEKYIFNF